jgi:hypothetical protein
MMPESCQDHPRLRIIAFHVADGVFVIVATASSGAGVPKVYWEFAIRIAYEHRGS